MAAQADGVEKKKQHHDNSENREKIQHSNQNAQETQVDLSISI